MCTFFYLTFTSILFLAMYAGAFSTHAYIVYTKFNCACEYFSLYNQKQSITSQEL